MKSQFRLVVIVIGFIAGFGLFCCENRANHSLKQEIRDLQLQLSQSVQRADTFIIRDSIPVWKERIVDVERSDYKKSLVDKKLIRDLGLRVEQLESENRVLLSSRDTVRLEVVKGLDSVLSYHDKWSDFRYSVCDSQLVYSVRDSLTTIVAREYKHKFLCFKWGTKGYNVFIVNHNPRCRVEYNKYIRLK